MVTCRLLVVTRQSVNVPAVSDAKMATVQHNPMAGKNEVSDEHAPSAPWLRVGGQPNEQLEARVRERLSRAIAERKIRAEDLRYLSHYRVALLERTAEFSDSHLELFRKLTVSWDLSVTQRTLSSHRPFVGRFIVFAKRLFFPLVRAALKEELSRQREFNGAVIEFLASSVAVPHRDAARTPE